ncbi:MAG: sulfatase-like hydrolase/transferase [Lentisphaeria bacterium]|nr:sulfatase-like hydrolase/transferase [Lentisphaeria bacterium]
MEIRLDRRRFLNRLAVGSVGVGALALAPPLAQAAPVRRPNVLFVLIDDLRWDAFGFMGHPFVRTPHIDRIRNEGALFENAFVTTSLCSPARASFLTGTYAHTHRVMGNNGAEFDPAVHPSFAQVLQAAGYETAYVGKWHQARRSDPRPGFDYWLSFLGQGVHNNPVLNEDGREFTAQGYMTDILTDYADRWLRRPHSKPWCLCLAHKAVHGPFQPPERDKGLFPDATMAEPPNWKDTFESKPRWQRAEHLPRDRRDAPVPDAVPAPPWDPRAGGRLNQLRMIKAIDDGIGRILATLTEIGQLDNTVVVFTSDNGYFHGEHRRGDKRLMYEESLRIPLVLRYPALVKPGTTISPMVLNIDVAPTFLDLAGATIPGHMQGLSFQPLLQGRTTPWRESFLYEYWVDLTPRIPDMVGVRTPDWKLVRYPGIDDLDELYDLRTDPHELHNLARDPDHAPRLTAMRAELDRLMKATNYRGRDPRPPAPPGELVLHYTFAAVDNNRVEDTSGKGNHGSARDVTWEAEPRGRAARFDGAGRIEVPNAPSLNPARRDWTVEAWARAWGDGVLVARGGASLGYMLFVRDGRPAFGVRDDNGFTVAQGTETVTDTWAHLVGVVAGTEIHLYVNGRKVAAAPLPGGIDRDPNDAMQIGGDSGSPIEEELSGKGFRGLLRKLRLYSHALTPEGIAKHAEP